MKTTPKMILTLGLVFGFISTGFAANEITADSGKNVQQYRSMVSADTVLKYGEALLVRSSVAKKLKNSSSLSDQERYIEAVNIFDEANKAFQAGEKEEAKKLALDSIRVIGRSVPQYYARIAKENRSQIARNDQ